MVNEYCRVPQWEATRTLAAVAQGLEKAELVVRDASAIKGDGPVRVAANSGKEGLWNP